MWEDFNPLIICWFFFPPRVGTIESSALKSLREKIYAHRSELISAFAQYDLNGTGTTPSLSTCHHGENSFHVCGRQRGQSPMERSPACLSVRLRAAEAGWPCFSWPQRRKGVGRGLAQTAWGDEAWRRKKKTERHGQIKKLCLLLDSSGRQIQFQKLKGHHHLHVGVSSECIRGSQGTGGMWNGSPFESGRYLRKGACLCLQQTHSLPLPLADKHSPLVWRKVSAKLRDEPFMQKQEVDFCHKYNFSLWWLLTWQCLYKGTQ